MAKKKNFFFKQILSFTDLELFLLKTSRVANRNKLKGWYKRNLLIPVLLVFTPYLIGLALPEINISFKEVMFNGGLTVVGVSVLFTMSSYLVRTKISFEEDASVSSKKTPIFEALSSLRDKMLNNTNFIVIASSIVYVYQVIYSSSKSIIEDTNANTTSFVWTDYVLLIVVVLLLFASTYFGKLNFELSDEFINESSGNFDLLYQVVEEQENETDQMLKDLKENGF